jgi:hypothetical protein
MFTQSSSWTSTPASELVVALLGGAFQSLVQSRFAFTATAAEVHSSELPGQGRLSRATPPGRYPRGRLISTPL